jgi:hypothetical protein
MKITNTTPLTKPRILTLKTFSICSGRYQPPLFLLPALGLYVGLPALRYSNPRWSFRARATVRAIPHIPQARIERQSLTRSGLDDVLGQCDFNPGSARYEFHSTAIAQYTSVSGIRIDLIRFDCDAAVSSADDQIKSRTWRKSISATSCITRGTE